MFNLGWAGYAALGYTIRGIDLLKQKCDSVLKRKDPSPQRLLNDPPTLREINWFHYSNETEKWESHALPEHTVHLPASLKLATFNVLHTGQWACDIVTCTSERWRYQLSTLLPGLDADIISLNEVSADYMRLLLQYDWIRRGYVLSHITTEHCSPRGNLILAKPQFVRKVYISYRSKLNSRESIVAEVPMANGSNLFVVGVHLRAYEQYPESRDVELTQLCKVMSEFKQPRDGVVIMGDFNLHSVAENQIIRVPYADVWAKLRPDEDGFTFDYQQNTMIPYLFPPERRRMRLDRIILDSAGGRFAADSIKMFANQPVPAVPNAPYVFASDHFGLQTEVRTN